MPLDAALETPTGFGPLLRHYRIAAGLTQEELAERAELSVRGVRYLERDLRRPYRDTVRRLADALSLSPEGHRILTRAARPATSSTGVGGTVPMPAGPLIGRERDIASVSDLLRREDVRLLTLTGVGGVGKTRLAFEVASQLRVSFADGVVSVPLVSVSDPELVASAIARAVGLQETGRLPVREALAIFLRERRTLLLLDNFEHVAAAASLVSALATSTSHLKVLVTSRVALRLRGEQQFPVSALELPEVTDEASVYALAANPAVDLFLRRAQAVKPDFALTQANGATVASICRRLEGLPLAIELAAARIRVLPPGPMLDRLAHRLSFLIGGALDLPARQRTMREAIAWSYDLLDPAEQLLFRRLAVFQRGCDLATIEAVCDAAGSPSGDILDGVEDLVRSSLLRVQETADVEPRFAMLETVREYALERLADSGEEDELRRHHADYFLTFTEESASKFFGPEQRQWLDRVEREHDNLRAVVQWCVEYGQTERGLRLAAGLWPLWYVRGYAEGRLHLAHLLALPGADAVSASRAGSLLGAGQLALWQGDYVAARTYLDESIRLYRTLRNERGTADALLCAGFASRVQEDYETARDFLEEGIALSRAIGHPFITAACLHHLGMIAVDADGDHAAAEPLLEESLMLYRRLGVQRFIGLVSFSLGNAVSAQGDRARAFRLFQDGLTELLEVGEKLAIPSAVDSFAHLAMDEGHAERAVRLSGAATALRNTSNTSVWPAVQRARERWLGAALAALGGEAFRRVWAEGRAMTGEQACAYALGEVGVLNDITRRPDAGNRLPRISPIRVAGDGGQGGEGPPAPGAGGTSGP